MKSPNAKDNGNNSNPSPRTNALSSSSSAPSSSTSTARSVREEDKKKQPRSREGIEELTLEKISRKGNDIRLESLVKELTLELGYGRDRILKRLIELEASKKIVLQERTPYRSFLSYARSTNSLWFWEAASATLLSLALIGVTSGAALYLRYVFGGLLILFLPGYSLIEYLYASKKELDGLLRIALSIGLSLAIVPLVGLVLNYTPFGIRLVPTAVSLTLLTLILLVLALKKKHSYYRVSKDIM